MLKRRIFSKIVFSIENYLESVEIREWNNQLERYLSFSEQRDRCRGGKDKHTRITKRNRKDIIENIATSTVFLLLIKQEYESRITVLVYKVSTS